MAKTGLGSSAALVTSLVGSLLSLFEVIDLREGKVTPKDKDLVHSLAQFTHCLAQGKIGSGFDVASAVYGSLQYRRFSPSVLEGLLNESQGDSSPPLKDLCAVLTSKRQEIPLLSHQKSRFSGL